MGISGNNKKLPSSRKEASKKDQKEKMQELIEHLAKKTKRQDAMKIEFYLFLNLFYLT